jgi:hypothetical protein
MSSGEEGCISSFEVDVDGTGESVDVFGGSLLLLEAAAATGRVDLSPHKFFVIINILIEETNSGNLETCFDVSRRSREMQRRVDNTRNVIHCHCMARRHIRPRSAVYGCRVEENDYRHSIPFAVI